MTRWPGTTNSRGRAQRPWARPRPILLALVLAPVSLVLGFLGYRAVERGYSTTDALYASLQLFTVGGPIPKDTTWQLDVARFLAPVAVVYAAVVTALGLLRHYAQRLLVALTAKGHVVVVGLGATGAEVAKGLRRRGHQVVALELDSRNPRIPAARAEDVKVVLGDGTSGHFLDRAQVRRARHVVVMAGDDSLNLEIAGAVRELVTGPAAPALRLHVAVSHVDLWRELSRTSLTAADGLSTEYVHLADRTAQRLLREATRPGASRLSTLLVAGDTPVAGRLVALALQRGLGAQPSTTVLASDPALLERLERDEPWTVTSGRVSVIGEDAEPDVVVVCEHETADAHAISRGLSLGRQYRSAEVLVMMYRPRSERTLTAAGIAGGRVRLVPAKIEALGQELLETSATEIMARARHEAYVGAEMSLGHHVGTNTSLVAWEELPDSLKESNRRFAESVSKAVGQLGAQLAPLTGVATDLDLPIPADQLEALARGEHERWMAALVQQGWRRTTGAKDPDALLHPLLVPWDELPEAERQKDRDAVRALPRMLAMVGYRLVLASRTEEDRGDGESSP